MAQLELIHRQFDDLFRHVRSLPSERGVKVEAIMTSVLARPEGWLAKCAISYGKVPECELRHAVDG